MPVFYIAKRVGTFLLIIWLAATVNFFLPRLGGENPVAQKLMQTAALGGNLHAGMHDMVKEYEAKFGLNRPLLAQYLTYLARHEPVRLQLFDRQLPAQGHRHDLGGAAVDDRAAHRDDAI